MKRTIHLHGHLRVFGEKYSFDVETPRQLLSALFRQVKGVEKVVRENTYYLMRGDSKHGWNIWYTEIDFLFGSQTDLHLIPYIAGSGGKAGGIVKSVVGLTLVTIATAGAALAVVGPLSGAGAALGAFAGAFVHAGIGGISFGSLALTGLALAAAGAASLLTSRPDLASGAYEDRELADQRPSFLFSGPRNQSAQGLPVPLVYGKVRTGSVTVSTGIITEAVEST